MSIEMNTGSERVNIIIVVKKDSNCLGTNKPWDAKKILVKYYLTQTQPIFCNRKKCDLF